MNTPNLFLLAPPRRSTDDAVSVLRFWCLFAPDEFTDARRARVEAFVTKAAIPDRRWPQAAAGDAAAAIGIALSRQVSVYPDLRFDVAMTAVLFCGSGAIRLPA